MMKLFFRITQISLIIIASSGCLGTQYTDLSKDKQYSKWIGKQFELKVDCFMVFYHNNNNKIKEKYFYLMRANSFAIKGDIKNYVGKKVDGLQLLALVPKGTMFEVVHIFFVDGFNVTQKDVYVRLLNSPMNANLIAVNRLFPFMWSGKGLFSEEYAKELKTQGQASTLTDI